MSNFREKSVKMLELLIKLQRDITIWLYQSFQAFLPHNKNLKSYFSKTMTSFRQNFMLSIGPNHREALQPLLIH